MATLHIHVDESGNFVFTSRGTRYYVFTAVWTYNPGPLANQFGALRHQLIKDGHFRPNVLDDLAGFHACDDPRPRRDAVIDLMLRHNDWNFAAMVIEKNRVNPTLYEPSNFYPKFLSMLLKFPLRGRVRPWTEQILIYTDRLPMGSRAESVAVNTTIKSVCQEQQPGKQFKVMHHCSESNYWLQIADYCS